MQAQDRRSDYTLSLDERLYARCTDDVTARVTDDVLHARSKCNVATWEGTARDVTPDTVGLEIHSFTFHHVRTVSWGTDIDNTVGGIQSMSNRTCFITIR